MGQWIVRELYHGREGGTYRCRRRPSFCEEGYGGGDGVEGGGEEGTSLRELASSLRPVVESSGSRLGRHDRSFLSSGHKSVVERKRDVMQTIHDDRWCKTCDLSSRSPRETRQAQAFLSPSARSFARFLAKCRIRKVERVSNLSQQGPAQRSGHRTYPSPAWPQARGTLLQPPPDC